MGAHSLVPIISNLPPTAALFSALLGSNPVSAILAVLPAPLIYHIPNATLNTLTSITWFPSTLQVAFMPSLQITTYIGALFCVVAAIFLALRGKTYIYDDKIQENNFEE